MAQGIRPGVSVEEFAKGADVVLNLGDEKTLTRDLAWTRHLVERLAKNAFFGPMTNPDPGITPELLGRWREDVYYGSGNQLFENPVNNFVVFTQMALGCLLAYAKTVSPEMTVAAAWAIHRVAKMGPPAHLLSSLPPEQRKYGKHWLVPRPDDERLIMEEAAAIAVAAAEAGVSQLFDKKLAGEELEQFRRIVMEELIIRTNLVKRMREKTREEAKYYLKTRYPRQYAPFYLRKGDLDPVYYVAPQVKRRPFEDFAGRVGISNNRWKDLLTSEGEIKPTALTLVLQRLLHDVRGETLASEIARRELKLIVDLAMISPSLGLALALRRTRVQRKHLAERPTLFHREEIFRVVIEVVPEARADIDALIRWVDVHKPQPVEGAAVPAPAPAEAPPTAEAGADGPSGRSHGIMGPVFLALNLAAGEPNPEASFTQQFGPAVAAVTAYSSPVSSLATVSAATFAGMTTFVNVVATPTMVTGTFVPAPVVAW
ncbi:MAG: hypothetical protein HYU99_09755 [Deltaproteobacteria bacterium]|nr:hypothetical protein [Deltaproteobacteria bacterium]